MGQMGYRIWCCHSYGLDQSLAQELPCATGAAIKKKKKLSSHCGATRSVLSLQHWDAGSIPGPIQWVKDPGLLQLQRRS